MTEIIKQPPIKFKRIFIHNLENRHLVKYPELFLENVEKEIFEPVKIKDQIVYQSKKIMTQNRKSYTEFECDNTMQTIKFKHPKYKITLTLHSMNSYSEIDGEMVANYYTV